MEEQVDDLATLIAQTMEATQKLQELHTRKHETVAKGELAQKQLTVEDAVHKFRFIPERFRAVVTTMLSNGVPRAIADLTPALDQTGVSVPFLTLVGKSGAGKTSTALAIPVARYLMAYMKHGPVNIDQRLLSWRFLHADDICTARKTSKLGEEPAELRKAMSWNPLIIDDVIGQKDIDGDLYRVIRYREENGYQTIITTGMLSSAVETAYGPQFSRRMFSGVTKIIERKT
jgi:DNA replication protein DnaC